MSLLEGRVAPTPPSSGQLIRTIKPTASLADEQFHSLQIVGRARIKGIEWDFDWLPRITGVLSFNADYLDSKFLAVTPFQSVTGLPSSGYIVGDHSICPNYQ